MSALELFFMRGVPNAVIVLSCLWYVVHDVASSGFLSLSEWTYNMCNAI